MTCSYLKGDIMSSVLPDLADAPLAVQNEMAALRTALDQEIPLKREIDRNLLIATWNIRAFGSLTEDWETPDGASPKRNYRGLHAIAEIASRFDVIAIQELTGDMRALRTLLKTLGTNWSFLMTDESKGDKGKNERLAFLFDTTRVRLSGMAGELAAPDDPDFLADLSPTDPFRQFARTPYAVSFSTTTDTFILTTVHILFGDNEAARVPELTAIAKWMKNWAKRSKRWHHNLLVLGDFNTDRIDSPGFQAFTSTGLKVPEDLHAVPRTVTNKKPGLKKFYDQIAWFTTGSRQQLTMEFIKAGGFNFTPILFQNEPKLTPTQMSWYVSDHLPLWAEFKASPRR
jgi:endonuclease/exonuclease/phosphatase family metal-dependent hydrolase